MTGDGNFLGREELGNLVFRPIRYARVLLVEILGVGRDYIRVGGGGGGTAPCKNPKAKG